MSERMPALFLGHGSPMNAITDNPFRDAWRRLGNELPTPRAVLCVSAHWETDGAKVCAVARPETIHDFGGFPPALYELQYPAPGAPELAQRARGLLAAAGIGAALETRRGYDHGVFVPLAVMYPDADVPVLAMSLQAGLDPAAHLAAGRALAPLRAEGVLIVASGSSYHNLGGVNAGAVAASRDFDAWLQQALCDASGAAREALLERWADAPAARHAHPREEHLLPRAGAAGAGGDDAGHCVWRQTDMLGAITLSSYRFGALPAG